MALHKSSPWAASAATELQQSRIIPEQLEISAFGSDQRKSHSAGCPYECVAMKQSDLARKRDICYSWLFLLFTLKNNCYSAEISSRDLFKWTVNQANKLSNEPSLMKKFFYINAVKSFYWTCLQGHFVSETYGCGAEKWRVNKGCSSQTWSVPLKLFHITATTFSAYVSNSSIKSGLA